jgi:hypothetical protein
MNETETVSSCDLFIEPRHLYGRHGSGTGATAAATWRPAPTAASQDQLAQDQETAYQNAAYKKPGQAAAASQAARRAPSSRCTAAATETWTVSPITTPSLPDS